MQDRLVPESNPVQAVYNDICHWYECYNSHSNCTYDKINMYLIITILLSSAFYPRDAMLARVFATATCLSVHPSVRHTLVLCLAQRKQDREMYTIW